MGACDFSSSKFQVMRLVPRVQGTSLGEPLIWGDASHTSMGLLVPWGLMTMGLLVPQAWGEGLGTCISMKPPVISPDSKAGLLGVQMTQTVSKCFASQDLECGLPSFGF